MKSGCTNLWRLTRQHRFTMRGKPLTYSRAFFNFQDPKTCPTFGEHLRPGGNMIDHVYISVSDISKSSDFYGAALKPLGWHDLGGYDGSSGPEGAPDYLYGFGDQ